MCNVKIVLKSENEDDMNTINTVEIEKSIDQANNVLADTSTNQSHHSVQNYILDLSQAYAEYTYWKVNIRAYGASFERLCFTIPKIRRRYD